MPDVNLSEQKANSYDAASFAKRAGASERGIVGESLAVRRIEDSPSATKNETTTVRVNEVLSAFAERDHNG